MPIGLLPIYPRWNIDPPTLPQFFPLIIVAGVICYLLIRRKTWGRHALLGLGFFALNLAPFLGLKAISYMLYTWVMDHFLYLPMIGLIGLAIAAFDDLGRKLSRHSGLAASA